MKEGNAVIIQEEILNPPYFGPWMIAKRMTRRNNIFTWNSSKINKLTSIYTQGKFARICVKIDLQKSLVPKIEVIGHCVKYGHKAAQCGEGVVQVVSGDGGDVGEGLIRCGPKCTNVIKSISEVKDSKNEDGLVRKPNDEWMWAMMEMLNQKYRLILRGMGMSSRVLTLVDNSKIYYYHLTLAIKEPNGL
ncbi:hypothetical protein CR513_04619, partial [Mucuna pruriens]